MPNSADARWWPRRWQPESKTQLVTHLAHRIREVAIRAAVLLLESDGERQQLLLGQVRKFFIGQGRSDQDSSPWSTRPQSLSQTPPSRRHMHRLPRGLGAGSANRR